MPGIERLQGRGRQERSRFGVARTRVLATPGSSLAAAYPGGHAADTAELAGLERSEGTGGIVERHLRPNGVPATATATPAASATS
jgi:hypothetical protein